MRGYFLIFASIIITCLTSTASFSQNPLLQMQQQQLERQRQDQRDFEERQRQNNQDIQNLLNSRGGSSLGEALLGTRQQYEQQQNQQQQRRFDEQERQNELYRQQQEAQARRDQDVYDQIARERLQRQNNQNANSYTPPPAPVNTPTPTNTPVPTPRVAGFSNDALVEYFPAAKVTSDTTTDRTTVNLDDFDASDEEGLVIDIPDEKPSEPPDDSCGCIGPYFMPDLLGFCVPNRGWIDRNPGAIEPKYNFHQCKNLDGSPSNEIR